MRSLLLSLPLAALVVGACGNSPPLVPLDDDDDDACAFDDVTAVPGDGAGPLHRTTPIAVTWNGGANDVAFDVRSAGHVVRGEVWTDAGRAVFVPLGPLPASALVEWRVSACGKSKSGAFLTGALLHPLEDLSQCIDKPYEVDLRRATLEAPSSGDRIGDVVLKWRIAPAMLLMVTAVDEETMTFYLVPGVADMNGVVAPDFGLPAQLVTGSIAQNPYIALQPKDLVVALGDGDVTLRDVELIIGLGHKGFEDGRIVAEVDTREMSASSDPCAVIESLTGEKCYPCDRGDDAGSCFLLEMSDVVGLPADVELERPVPAPETPTILPCRGAGCSQPSPETPPPLDPRWPCPDGVVCPERVPPPVPSPTSRG